VKVVYAQEPLPATCAASIFLAGPTPRDASVPSWRPEAIALLRAKGFDGTVFVPEPEGSLFDESFAYEAQVEWESRTLARADVIVFWVPRRVVGMPALTTNDEWGFHKDSGRVVFGAPDDAEKVRYQRWWADQLAVPHARTLDATLDHALAQLGEVTAEDRRAGGECDVPLAVWRRPEFKRWHARQKSAGNTLVAARLLWTFRAGSSRSRLVFWALQVDVHVGAEGRRKHNEVLLGRADVSATVLYRRAARWRDTEVVLVREFRSPGSAPDGFVHELPAGSSFHAVTPLRTAVEEVAEEVGLTLAPEALRDHGSRPLMATMSTHHGHVFSCELDVSAITALRASAHTPRGLAEHSEQTWVEVRTVGDLLEKRDVDWSTLGMVLAVLHDAHD
jgi:8-oxo-dGTP pyrophosphatase MutT (NUDIX family)